MNIKSENLNTFYRENKDFNDDINPLVTELLETNSTGRINYKISEPENFYLTKRHHYHSGDKKNKGYLRPQKDNQIKNYTKYNGLGPLEFSLALYLLNKRIAYNVIVLTGALGSGKSSLCRYTLNYIENSSLDSNDILHFPENGIIYRIDLNDFEDSDHEKVIVEFKLELITQLTSLIGQIHSKELFVEAFITKIKSGKDDRFSKFSEFVRKLNRQGCQTEEEKFDFLLDWLDDYESQSFKLRLILYILAFVKESRENKDKIDFIILIDNIDKLADDDQLDILNLLFSFSIKLPIKILVPMRLTTFGKVKGNGSYSFAVFENTGHPPVKILLERLNHYVSHNSEYEADKKASPDYLKHLNRKIKALISDLENPIINRLTPFYASIAGNSIRRGLYLSERFFINSVIKYDEHNQTQDDFAKALLIDNNENGMLFNDDRLINNIFSGQDNLNSLIKIRILQVLDFYNTNGWTCKMNLLLSQISLFEEYTNDEIVSAINDLICVSRRLIYIEGVKQYKDYNILSQSSNDIIQLTYAGSEYLATLVYNIVYLQSVIVAIRWKVPNSFKNLDYLSSFIHELHENSTDTGIVFLFNLLENRKANIADFITLSYDHNNINERMRILRECLYFLMLNDLNQIAIYYESNNLQNIDAVDNRYINHSIMIDLIGKVSVSVLNIIRSTVYYNNEEAANWFDLVLIAQLWHKTMFKSDNASISTAITHYEKEGVKKSA